VDLDAALFGRLIRISPAEAERIADALAQSGIFDRRAAVVCAREGCGVVLSPVSLEEGTCGNCGADLDELEPREEIRYVLDRPRSRDVGWLTAIHGIRTRGPWQEQLQWLVDRQFLRTIPFKNWKYGRILFAALIPALQRRIVRRFLNEMRVAQTELGGVLGPGPAPPPDVVAHSFGTWVVAHALQEEPTLRLGHVILVGSIVRPDWPWAAILERDQINAVLNYCGDRDHCVQLTERFIPDSGPSGRVGFTEEHSRLINILRPGGTHSSTFTNPGLSTTFEDVWRPFLSDRREDIDRTDHQILEAPPWAPSWFIWRAPAPLFLGLAIVAGVISGVTLAVL
jgi:hypothetical protein